MTFKYADNYNTTLSTSPIAGATSFGVTSASGFPALAGGDFTVVRLNHGNGTAENARCTAISGTTVTCDALANGHTAGEAVNGPILNVAALDQLKLDADISGKSGNNGQSALSGNFSLTGSSLVYQDTGLSIALPAAGTYDIEAVMRGVIVFSAGSFAAIAAKLYNSTDAADASGWSQLAYADTAGVLVSGQGVIRLPRYTVAGAKTIKLYAAREFDETVDVSVIAGVSTQDTTITWERRA